MKTTRWLGLLLVVMSMGGLSGAATTPEISVANGTGYGTTGIYARTFGSVIVSTGTAITYVPSAVNGDSFVINTSGVYAVSYSDGNLNTDDVGISLNLDPTISFRTYWGTGQELCLFETSNTGESCSVTMYFSKGSVLRAHSTFGGPPPNTQPGARFIVTKIP